MDDFYKYIFVGNGTPISIQIQHNRIYILTQMSIGNGKPVSCNTYVQFYMLFIALSLEPYDLAGGPHRREQIFEIGKL